MLFTRDQNSVNKFFRLINSNFKHYFSIFFIIIYQLSHLLIPKLCIKDISNIIYLTQIFNSINLLLNTFNIKNIN